MSFVIVCRWLLFVVGRCLFLVAVCRLLLFVVGCCLLLLFVVVCCCVLLFVVVCCCLLFVVVVVCCCCLLLMLFQVGFRWFQVVSGGLKLFQVVNCLSEKVGPSEKVGYAKAFAWYTFSTRNALHFRLYQPHSCPAQTCSRQNIHCRKIYMYTCVCVCVCVQNTHAGVKIYIVSSPRSSFGR